MVGSRLAFIISLILVANGAAMGQSASELTIADYNATYQMILRLRPIGNDVAGFITSPPAASGDIPKMIQTQDCMIRLTVPFQNVESHLSEISNLVGLSTKMKDEDDREWVMKSLRIRLSGLLADMPFSLHMIDTITRRCAQDGATVAKVQEIKRAFGDVQVMVQSLADRTGAKPLSRQ